jgi:uncharacterized membrane protein
MSSDLPSGSVLTDEPMMGRPDMDPKTRLLDFLTIALPGLLVLVGTAVLVLLGARGPRYWQLGMALVGLTFLGIWLRVYLLRLK